MILNNKSVIERINQAIIFHNEDSKDEQINLVTNGEIKDEDLKKIKLLHIDIGDISKEEINPFFEELGNVLEIMKLKGLYIYSNNENIAFDVDMTFLEKVNRELKDLQISNIDLSNVDENVFNQFENLKVLILENNNIRDLEMLSKLNEELAVDMGNNPMNNVSISEVVNEIKIHKGRLAFNGHQLFNAMVFGLEDKKVSLGNYEISDDRLDEVIHFFNENEIKVIARPEELRRMNERPEKIKHFYGYIFDGTKDISTQYLEEHPEILEVEIRDDKNGEFAQPFYTYTREDFIQIRRKIDEIKQQIVIPEENDADREKKIFMQVYKILGEMIEYNYYAISEEGKKDFELTESCRSLKDGLLKGKAVCAGYANILKNIIEEFGIEAKYISAEQDKLSEFYDEKDPERSCME